MHRFSIRFGNDSQIFANIENERPATNTPVGLYFCADGVIQDMRDPFVFEIGSAQQDTGNDKVQPPFCRSEAETKRSAARPC